MKTNNYLNYSKHRKVLMPRDHRINFMKLIKHMMFTPLQILMNLNNQLT